MSERDGFQPGVPCWVDTWQPDAAAAVAFYGDIFGWEIEGGEVPGESVEYHMGSLRGRDVAAIGAPVPAGAPTIWTTYIWVENADETAAKVTAAGGSLLMEPFDSMDGGRMAIAADPFGAAFGIWQPGEHKGAQVVNEAGAWAWSQLLTPDKAGAEAFYGAVFGWEADSFGELTLFRVPGYVGGEPEQPVSRDVVAGMLPLCGEDVPPLWRNDFWVDDVDDVVAKATARGGKVVVPAQDSPIARQAVLSDPQGAVFSVSKIIS